MANIGFFWRDDYVRKYAQLTPLEFGVVILACTNYHATGEVPALEGKASLVFDAIRDDIDASNRAYEAKCETNRRNRMSAAAYKAAQPKPVHDGGSQALPVTCESKRQDSVAGAKAQSAKVAEGELLSSLAKGGQLQLMGPEGERFLLEVKDGQLQIIGIEGQ